LANGDQLVSVGVVWAVRQTCPASSMARTSMRPSAWLTAVTARSLVVPGWANGIHAVQRLMERSGTPHGTEWNASSALAYCDHRQPLAVIR
jgi:hypothetical protein